MSIYEKGLTEMFITLKAMLMCFRKNKIPVLIEPIDPGWLVRPNSVQISLNERHRFYYSLEEQKAYMFPCRESNLLYKTLQREKDNAKNAARNSDSPVGTEHKS